MFVCNRMSSVRAPSQASVESPYSQQQDAIWPLLGRYRSRIRIITRTVLGATHLDKVTTESLDRWYTSLHSGGTSAANIRNYHALLRRALGQGVRWGWIRSNPVTLATSPRVARPQVRAMSAEDVIAVIEAASAESLLAGLALRLAAVTGVRRGELVGLQWDDLDGDLLTVSRSLTAVYGNRKSGKPTSIAIGPTKTHAMRRLTLDADSIALIGAWRDECTKDASALRTDLGPWMISLKPGNAAPSSPDLLTRIWARARAAAGINPKWRLHDLRHWAATTLIAGGEDIRLVAGRLGHARPATTLDVYAHFIDRADGRAANALAMRLARRV
jgi:integrase